MSFGGGRNFGIEIHTKNQVSHYGGEIGVLPLSLIDADSWMIYGS